MKLKLSKNTKSKLKQFWNETKSAGSSVMKNMNNASRGFGTSAEMITKSFEVPRHERMETREYEAFEHLKVRPKVSQAKAFAPVMVRPNKAYVDLTNKPRRMRRNPFEMI
jgi:hypothetical protein